MIIGIDNGTSGGLAAISASHGLLIAAAPMPKRVRTHGFHKTKKRTKKGVATKITAPAQDAEIDAAALVDWIVTTTNGKPCTIAIEECPEHAQQKSIMRAMAISYGILIGAISACLPNARLIVVRSGNPKDSWQRAMLGDCEKGETKAQALIKASQLWPEEDWLATPRSTKPHEGMIDAALIAMFARKHLPDLD